MNWIRFALAVLTGGILSSMPVPVCRCQSSLCAGGAGGAGVMVPVSVLTIDTPPFFPQPTDWKRKSDLLFPTAVRSISISSS
jgi:hypothetical protein